MRQAINYCQGRSVLQWHFVLAFVFAILCGKAVFAQGSLELIVRSGSGGSIVPGGGTFDTFDSYSLNNLGQVSFNATLTNSGSNDTGVFRGDGSSLIQIAREGQASPAGSTFGSLASTETKINNSGQVAFRAGAGIFRGPTSIQSVVAQGDNAPDNNGTFQSFQKILLNENSQLAFHAFLIGTNGDGNDNLGLFASNDSGVVQIVREGDFAPNSTRAFSSFFNFEQNDSGQVAFYGFLNDTTVNEGIYRGDGGALAEVARMGQTPPDGNGTFDKFLASAASDGKGSVNPEINSQGEVAFAARLIGTSGGTSDAHGLYKGSGGTLTKIVRGGDATPDSSGTFLDFSAPAINDSGQTAFYAALDVPGSTNPSGIFVADGGAITQVARARTAPPEGNGLFLNFGAATPAFNNVGQVAFLAGLTDSGNSGALIGSGIYFYDPDLGLSKALRTGDSFAGGTIAELSLVNGTDFREKGRTGLNDFGKVAFHFVLTNGDEGIAAYTAGLAGDYNNDGTVNAADYTTWLDVLGGDTLVNEGASPGIVDQADYNLWKVNFGATSASNSIVTETQIPEPSSIAVALLACFACLAVVRVNCR